MGVWLDHPLYVRYILLIASVHVSSILGDFDERDCTSSELLENCPPRYTGAPFTRCTIYVGTFVAASCEGYPEEWTANCGVGGLDNALSCRPGGCSGADYLWSWCGPYASSCTRRGAGESYVDTCACLIPAYSLNAPCENPAASARGCYDNEVAQNCPARRPNGAPYTMCAMERYRMGGTWQGNFIEGSCAGYPDEWTSGCGSGDGTICHGMTCTSPEFLQRSCGMYARSCQRLGHGSRWVDTCTCLVDSGDSESACVRPPPEVLPCTQQEVTQYCAIRLNGAPYAQCDIDNVESFEVVANSCTGYLDEWTSGCGALATPTSSFNDDTICRGMECTSPGFLYRSCGRYARSCQRLGVGDQWEDTCICMATSSPSASTCASPVTEEERDCQSDMGDLSLCPPAPMAAVGCRVVYSTAWPRLDPTLVVGSCVYDPDAVLHTCGQNAIGGSVVLYDNGYNRNNTDVFDPIGWTKDAAWEYQNGSTRESRQNNFWLAGVRSAVRVSNAIMTGVKLWSVPRCRCLDPSNHLYYEVWHDVEMQNSKNCDSYIDLAYQIYYYGDVTRYVELPDIRRVPSPSTYCDGTISGLRGLLLPQSIVYMTEWRYSAWAQDTGVIVNRPYVGVGGYCACPSFPGRLRRVGAWIPTCDWIVDGLPTNANSSGSSLSSFTLCDLWHDDDPSWACSASTGEPRPCGTDMDIFTVCPVGPSPMVGVPLTPVGCIDYCQSRTAPVATLDRDCDADLGEFTLCPADPMAAVGCRVSYAPSQETVPVTLVAGSCVYDPNAVVSVCGQNSVDGYAVVYGRSGTYVPGAWTEEWFGLRQGPVYGQTMNPWLSYEAHDRILVGDEALGVYLWSIPRCRCLDPNATWYFEVWQDVSAQRSRNCDSYLHDKIYKEYVDPTSLSSRPTQRHDLLVPSRVPAPVAYCNSQISGLMGLRVPESLLSQGGDTRWAWRDLGTIANRPYTGIMGSCVCPSYPFRLQRLGGWIPDCSWILNDSTTTAILRDVYIKSVDVCHQWRRDDKRWACSQSTGDPVPCGPGTEHTHAVCPTDPKELGVALLASMECIEFCQCRQGVYSLERPCDVYMSACTALELANFCGVRPSGAPYTQCEVFRGLVFPHLDQHVLDSCTGYPDEWTAGCGDDGVLDQNTACHGDQCSDPGFLLGWCGPFARSCLRHGSGGKWVDVCTCLVDNDPRVAVLRKFDNSYRRKYLASTCAQWPQVVYSKRRVFGPTDDWDPEEDDYWTSSHEVVVSSQLNLAHWMSTPTYFHGGTRKSEEVLIQNGLSELTSKLRDFTSAPIASGGLGRPASVVLGASSISMCGYRSAGYDVVLYRGDSHSIPQTMGWSGHSAFDMHPPDKPRDGVLHPQPVTHRNHPVGHGEFVHMVRLRCICPHNTDAMNYYTDWLDSDTHPDMWVQTDTWDWETQGLSRYNARFYSPVGSDEVCDSRPRPANDKLSYSRECGGWVEDTTELYSANKTYEIHWENIVSCGRYGRCVNPQFPFPAKKADESKCKCADRWTGLNCSTYTGSINCPIGCPIDSALGECVCTGMWTTRLVLGQWERVSKCSNPEDPPELDPCGPKAKCTQESTLATCSCTPPWLRGISKLCLKTSCFVDGDNSLEGCANHGVCQADTNGTCLCDTDPMGKDMWSGKQCTIPWCQGICENGGKCTVTAQTDQPNCVCQPGTYGVVCEFSYTSRIAGGVAICAAGSTFDVQTSTCTCSLGGYGDLCDKQFSDPAVCGLTRHELGWCGGHGECTQQVTLASGDLTWHCGCDSQVRTGSRCMESICPLSTNGISCHSAANECNTAGLCVCNPRADAWQVSDFDISYAAFLHDPVKMFELLGDVVKIGASCDVGVLLGCADLPVRGPHTLDSSLRTISVESLCGGGEPLVGECVVDETSRTAECVCRAGFTYTEFGNVSRCSPNMCLGDCIHGSCRLGGTCTCHDPTKWTGAACNETLCPSGTRPMHVDSEVWECICIDPDFMAPSCDQKRCPMQGGSVCGDHWFHAHLDAGPSYGLPKRFPFEYNPDTLAGPTGVACDGATGSCVCFDRLYSKSSSTGTCVPLMNLSNTLRIEAADGKYNNVAVDIIVTCNASWDSSTWCRQRTCRGHGVELVTGGSDCISDEQSELCCCDEGFSGTNCETEYTTPVCGQHSLRSGSDCDCVHPWSVAGVDGPGPLSVGSVSCEVSLCDERGVDPHQSIAGDASQGFHCQCISSYWGQFCDQTTGITAAPTHHKTLDPTSNPPSVVIYPTATPSRTLVHPSTQTATPTRYYMGAPTSGPSVTSLSPTPNDSTPVRHGNNTAASTVGVDTTHVVLYTVSAVVVCAVLFIGVYGLVYMLPHDGLSLSPV